MATRATTFLRAQAQWLRRGLQHADDSVSLSIVLDAHDRAHEENFTGTDESSLVERYGGVVRVVLGTRSNLKVTFPEDFAVAEAMMKARS